MFVGRVVGLGAVEGDPGGSDVGSGFVRDEFESGSDAVVERRPSVHVRRNFDVGQFHSRVARSCTT